MVALGLGGCSILRHYRTLSQLLGLVVQLYFDPVYHHRVPRKTRLAGRMIILLLRVGKVDLIHVSPSGRQAPFVNPAFLPLRRGIKPENQR